MKVTEQLLNGTVQTVKVGQVLRTCSIGNIRIEKIGRKPRVELVGTWRCIIGCIEKDGNVLCHGLIGELLCWDTPMQPFSLDGIEDTRDPTVDISKNYKALDKVMRIKRR